MSWKLIGETKISLFGTGGQVIQGRQDARCSPAPKRLLCRTYVFLPLDRDHSALEPITQCAEGLQGPKTTGQRKTPLLVVADPTDALGFGSNFTLEHMLISCQQLLPIYKNILFGLDCSS